MFYSAGCGWLSLALDQKNFKFEDTAAPLSLREKGLYLHHLSWAVNRKTWGKVLMHCVSPQGSIFLVTDTVLLEMFVHQYLATLVYIGACSCLGLGAP